MYLNLKSIYLENVSINVLNEILVKLYDNGFISDYYYILHDKDVNNEGLIKKEHYHIIINYVLNDKKRSYIEIARKNPIIKELYELAKSNIDNNIEKVKNTKQMLRYLIHLDNKEKYQYNIDEVITNNKELFDDVIVNQIKTSEIDNCLNELLALKQEEITTKEIFNHFKNYSKLSYCLQYIDKVKFMLNVYGFVIKE